jgi:hypothetical protein
MSWHHEKDVNGWRVVWSDGAAGWYSFAPTQCGRVRSTCYQNVEPTPCAFGVICERVAELLPRLKERRFGTRYSAERGVLCGRISSHLNGLGFKPVAAPSASEARAP